MSKFNERARAAALAYQQACNQNSLALVGRDAKPTEALISEDAFYDGYTAALNDELVTAMAEALKLVCKLVVDKKVFIEPEHTRILELKTQADALAAFEAARAKGEK